MPRMRTLAIAALALLAHPALAEDLYATFETSAGKIGVKLLSAEAPKTVKNFVDLAQGKKEWTEPATGKKVKRPLYEGTLFHRVIPSFMIQGGRSADAGRGHRRRLRGGSAVRHGWTGVRFRGRAEGRRQALREAVPARHG
jgi:hypothetical protein